MADRPSHRSVNVAVRLTCLVLCGLVLVTGCTKKPKGLPDLAPVTGTVTMDGQPLADATIAFASESGGNVAFGGTDASGKYELRFGGPHKGAAVGPNVVSISTHTNNPVSPDWKDPIPAKYNKKTELKAEVKPGRNTIDFELTSK